MPTEARTFVEYALSIGALELLPEGRTLKSGRISPYFFNSGLFNNGESLCRLAEVYASTIMQMPTQPEVLFGPAYKGIPLVAAVSTVLYYKYGVNIGYTFNRKEEKDHGEGGTLVGASCKGKGVAIVDDVITTGKSVDESVDMATNAGGHIMGVVIGFDRQEKSANGDHSARQRFEKRYEIRVFPSVTLYDLIAVLQESAGQHEILQKILAYREEYGETVGI